MLALQRSILQRLSSFHWRTLTQRVYIQGLKLRGLESCTSRHCRRCNFETPLHKPRRIREEFEKFMQFLGCSLRQNYNLLCTSLRTSSSFFLWFLSACLRNIESLLLAFEHKVQSNFWIFLFLHRPPMLWQYFQLEHLILSSCRG